MNTAVKPPEDQRSRGPVLFGVVGLVAFPLAGAALVGHLVEPLTFVAISLTALVLFGAAMMKLHRA